MSVVIVTMTADIQTDQFTPCTCVWGNYYYELTNDVHLYPVASSVPYTISSCASVVASVTRSKDIFSDGK